MVDQLTGWIHVDHKSAPFAFQDWDRLAEIHGGQLDAYAQAVEKTTGRPAPEKWFYLQIAGAVHNVECWKAAATMEIQDIWLTVGDSDEAGAYPSKYKVSKNSRYQR